MSAVRKAAGSPAFIYQIKVTLKDIRPPVWRRIQVSSDTTLGKLHRILQVIMGWADDHLHQFIDGETYYSVPSSEDMFPASDERKVKLAQIVSGEKDRFTYEYDFGDSWLHELLVEKILPPEEEAHYPRCLKGKRATPPEDCGGPWGYAGFLEAMRDANHPDHEDMLEWYGESFDPEAFDLEGVNEELRHIR